jgi:flagellar basal body-associated protein FliL
MATKTRNIIIIASIATIIAGIGVYFFITRKKTVVAPEDDIIDPVIDLAHEVVINPATNKPFATDSNGPYEIRVIGGISTKLYV